MVAVVVAPVAVGLDPRRRPSASAARSTRTRAARDVVGDLGPRSSAAATPSGGGRAPAARLSAGTSRSPGLHSTLLKRVSADDAEVRRVGVVRRDLDAAGCPRRALKSRTRSVVGLSMRISSPPPEPGPKSKTCSPSGRDQRRQEDRERGRDPADGAGGAADDVRAGAERDRVAGLAVDADRPAPPRDLVGLLEEQHGEEAGRGRREHPPGDVASTMLTGML